ncbi:MAG: hypothetical protein PUB35_04835 [Campylobacteraceae bacterium]|nr:hypothetical protein [Campylobacteraceae bacterium]
MCYNFSYERSNKSQDRSYKISVNTLLIAFFAVCGYIYINFAALGIYEFLVAMFGGMILLLFLGILLVFFNEFLKELKNANS